MKWQPIETAPKDGTQILIYDPADPTGSGVNQAKWDRSNFVEVVEEYGVFWPSHWMPLPQPPHAGETE